MISVLVLGAACGQDDERNDSGTMKRATSATTSVNNSNAETQSKTLILTWTDKIDSKKFGLAPDAVVDGKTLQDIITSVVVGRDDGEKCSSCHNSVEAMGNYGLNVPKNGANPQLKGTDLVGDPARSWVGKGGWAERFVTNDTKPENLKLFMKAWVDGGYK